LTCVEVAFDAIVLVILVKGQLFPKVFEVLDQWWDLGPLSTRSPAKNS